MSDTAADVRAPARRAAGMPRSAIREIMALAAGRPEVIHLEVGEPDHGTPDHIIEAAFQAARDGFTRYTANNGLPGLRELIARRQQARTGLPCTADQVVVTVGAVGALYTALMSVMDAGDEILLPDPGWPNYEAIVRLGDGVPVRYRLDPDNGFLPDIDEISRAVTPRTKAIMINSPGNPTGAVFPRELMDALGKLASRTGLYVISDEIYEDILFDGLAHVSAYETVPPDRVLIVSGVSKSYAMTGWRLGHLICPPDLVGLPIKLQEPIVSCASAISQKAAEAALSGPQDIVEDGRKIFQRRRDILVEVFADSPALPVRPKGAFYGLVRIPSDAASGLDFAKRFLVEENVATVPGETFGEVTSRFVRVAFTCSDDDLRAGLTKLRRFLEK